MPSIDERVVAMAFENAKFEQAIAQTMRTLDTLNKALAQVGASSGFDKIEQQANKVTFQGPMSAMDKLKQKLGMSVDTKPITDMEGAANKVTMQGPLSALDKLKQKLGWVGGGNELQSLQGQSDRVDMSNVSNQADEAKRHFDALRFAAIVAFGTIVHRATNLGLNLAKSMTVQPLIDGFKNYETQINAVQTIQANTGLTGKKGLGQIKGALGDLNEYANKTVYNFSEMARNIGTFTAAGVDLKTATGSIKGIANLAAASGSTSQQASTAMYQLSQAIAAGRVNLQDWNSVVNAGMGGQMFQKALVNTAEAMGTLDSKSVTMGKHMKINGESFRNAIASKPGQKSWLTGDVLTQTLQNFTGDMSKAQLAAKGFNDAQIKVIQTQAKVAVDAATKIKTFSQMMDALKEEVASAWSGVWSTLFGDIGQAKALFTPLHNTLQNLLTGPVNGFNKALQAWAKMGGRTMLFAALKSAFQSLGKILGAVHSAFRDIFPASTGKSLLTMTQHFANFAKAIKPSSALIENLRGTFRGLFAVLDIGWQIVKKVVGVIFDLLGVAKGGAGGFLAFTGGIGNFLVAIDNAIKKGHALDGFFNGLTNVLKVPLHILGLIAHAFFGLFGGVDAGKAKSASDSINSVSDSLKPMGHLVDKVQEGWKKLVGFFKELGAKVGPMIHRALEPILHLGDTIGNAFKGMDTEKMMSILQTVFMGGIFLTLKKALSGGVSVTVGKLDGLNKVLGGLTANLKAMEQAVKAAVLLEIATAILALAAGVKLLSGINPTALDRAMTAVAIGLGELVGALFLLSKATTGLGFASMPILAASMIGLAVAVTILAGALKIFATMKWDDILKGFAGVVASLKAVQIGIKGMGSVRLAVIAPGLILIGVALNIMALAMKQFASLSWKEIERGLFGMTGALIALAFALDQFGPQTLIMGPALAGVAIAMTMLAGAVGAFGALHWDVLGKGLAGVTASLLLIGAALWEMPPGPMLAAQAAGLLILSFALGGITAAVKILGGMSVVGIAKGLVALGGAMFELAVGLDIMTASAPGAVALIAVAAGLALLAPTLAFMGHLKWGTIFKGLAAIAASLLVLSVVGDAAMVGLVGLGIGLAALAASVLIAGTGIFLIGKGLASISETSAKALSVMIAAMTAFILAIPGLIVAFVKGIVEALGEVAKIAPQVVDSLIKITGALVDGLIEILPKAKKLLESLIDTFVQIVNDKSGALIAAGWHLFVNLLSGIDKNISTVIDKGASIVLKFLNGLTQHAPELLAAGARLIVTYLAGVTRHIPRIVGAAGLLIATFITSVANQIPRIVLAGVRIITKFLDGLAKAIPRVRKSAIHLMRVFLHNLSIAALAVVNTAFNVVIRFANGLADAIDKHRDKLRQAGMHLLGAVLNGVTFGMAGHVWNVGKSVIGFFEDAVTGGHKHVEFHPGRTVAQGLEEGNKALGIATPKSVKDSARKHGQKHGKAVADAFNQGVADGTKQRGLHGINPNPKITPVLDLSEVKKKSGELNNLTRPKQVAHVSLAHASAASRGAAATQAAQHAHHKAPARTVQFVQNNTSPKSLSTREIYRRTNNQLSRAKHKLGLIDGGVLLAGE